MCRRRKPEAADARKGGPPGVPTFQRSVLLSRIKPTPTLREVRFSDTEKTPVRAIPETAEFTTRLSHENCKQPPPQT